MSYLWLELPRDARRGVGATPWRFAWFEYHLNQAIHANTHAAAPDRAGSLGRVGAARHEHGEAGLGSQNCPFHFQKP